MRKGQEIMDKIGEIIEATKIAEVINAKKEDEKFKNILRIVLICAGAFVILAAAGFVVYKLVSRKDDYDFYDDLDNYYEEDEDEEEDEAE